MFHWMISLLEHYIYRSMEERAAIAEYEGCVSLEAAEALAYACYIHKYKPECKAWYPLPE
jgi:hypothetical protein